MIKKIKAPIGDENCNNVSAIVWVVGIKKIKAPIGDENSFLYLLILGNP